MLLAEPPVAAARAVKAPLARGIDAVRGTFHPFVGPVLCALAYYAGARVGFALQSPVTPQSFMWLPNSVLLAVLLVVPMSRWPRFLVAVLPAQLLVATQTHAPLATMTMLYVSNCMDSMLGAALTRRFSRGRVEFRDLHGMLVFMLCAAILSPVLLSLVDAGITTLSGWGSSYRLAFATRARSNILTHMVVVPALVTALGMSAAQWKAVAVRRWVAACAVLSSIVVTAMIMFIPANAYDGLPNLAFGMPALIALLLLLAVYFGPGTTGLGLLAIAFIANWEVIRAGASVAGLPAADSVAALQYVLLSLAIPFLCLAAATRERSLNSSALRNGYSRIRALTYRALAAQQSPTDNPVVSLTSGNGTYTSDSEVSARASEVSGAFAVTLSHELRQPLTAIRSNAQAGLRLLAAEPPRLQELQSILQDIVADDTLAAGVIERTHALLRDDSPRLDEVNLNEVCERAWRVFAAEPGVASTTFSFEFDEKLPSVRGDAIQLQQVVLNLLVNALDATADLPTQDRRVTLSTARDGTSVRISVSDNGPGIAQGVQPFLFQPFFSTKHQGLGMGLAIVRSIVEHHRGLVIAENGADGGAVFSVVLPYRRSNGVG